MIGAIIGDIAGSRFEWANHKSKEFDLFDRKCSPTDDSIMSLAVAKAILECGENYEELPEKAVSCMQELGRIYKNAGYGGSFMRWLQMENPQPYHSFGNGAGMRVGPCGFAAKSLEDAKRLSAMVTEITHDHPEGMKGAEAVSAAVFLAKSGKDRKEIRAYIEEHYYNIDFTLDQIRETYTFDVTCQGSIPVALEAFFEAEDFEDTIRNAVSVGGDSDTIAAIAGSVAEAYFGVPEEIIGAALRYLDDRQKGILFSFEEKYPSKAITKDGHSVSVYTVIDQIFHVSVSHSGAEAKGAQYPDPDNDADVQNYMRKTDRLAQAGTVLKIAGVVTAGAIGAAGIQKIRKSKIMSVPSEKGKR